jgi:hypothetical protein
VEAKVGEVNLGVGKLDKEVDVGERDLEREVQSGTIMNLFPKKILPILFWN